MSKVYITRKKLNEDVAITDSTLAQQYLAVKKQMADKRTKRDQLMKNVNQIDNEMNILEKNLIAIEMKSAQSQGEVKATKPENREQPAVDNTGTEVTANESLNEDANEEALNDFREEVIDYIGNVEEYPDAETLVWEFDEILNNCYYDDQPPEHCGKLIIDADRNTIEEDGYIGGDTQGKIAANQAIPYRVQEAQFNTRTKLADKYEEDTVLLVKGKEKIVQDVEKFSNGAIITFRDGSEYSADELNSLNAKYIRHLDPDELEDDYENDEEFYQRLFVHDDEVQALEQELQEIEAEYEQAMSDMEQDLAGYDEGSWVPDVNPRKTLKSGERKDQTMPHDVWGGILQELDERKDKIKAELRKLKGIGESEEEELTYDDVIKRSRDLEENTEMTFSQHPAPTNLAPTNESVYDEIMDNLEDEKEKIQTIQDFIMDVTQKIEVDIHLPDDVEINDEEPEILEPEPEAEILEPIEVEPEAPEDVPFDIVQYDMEDDMDPYDMSIHSEPYDEDPFTPTEDEILTNETLKAEEGKREYIPELMEEEDVETELAMMNYEDDDQFVDEYLFHVRIDGDTDHEIIAKFFKDDEDDFWTVRVVKGDEEPLQSMEFDPRLDYVEIIGKLATIYDDIEIIDPKEYEYLLDDKEKVDAEYYSDLVEESEMFKPKSGEEIHKDYKEMEVERERIENYMEDTFDDYLLKLKVKRDLIQFRIDMDKVGYDWGPTDFTYYFDDKMLVAESNVPGGEGYIESIELEDIYDAIINNYLEDPWEFE